MQKLILTAIALVLSGCATLGTEPAPQTYSRWHLVLAHDAEGNALEGSKSDLIAAVQNGKPIRIYTAGRRIQHSYDALFLSVFDGEIFAQSHPIDAQQPVSDPARIIFRQPGQKWRSIIGTNGAFIALMDGNPPNQRQGAARWFVQD
ncbi:MAG: hypothetical protein ABJO01_11230 [Parasphingorhabdus sp.]|uniref:hypothetical protein n=1 Tax=Parasphingorhabdus sp. TaxID=2709688 RepID=UPI0032998D21